MSIRYRARCRFFIVPRDINLNGPSPARAELKSFKLPFSKLSVLKRGKLTLGMFGMDQAQVLDTSHA